MVRTRLTLLSFLLALILAGSTVPISRFASAQIDVQDKPALVARAFALGVVAVDEFGGEDGHVLLLMARFYADGTAQGVLQLTPVDSPGDDDDDDDDEGDEGSGLDGAGESAGAARTGPRPRARVVLPAALAKFDPRDLSSLDRVLPAAGSLPALEDEVDVSLCGAGKSETARVALHCSGGRLFDAIPGLDFFIVDLERSAAGEMRVAFHLLPALTQVGGVRGGGRLLIEHLPGSGGRAVGDADGDGVATARDLSILSRAWQRRVGSRGYDARVDFNDDGWVSHIDLAILRVGMIGQ